MANHYIVWKDQTKKQEDGIVVAELVYEGDPEFRDDEADANCLFSFLENHISEETIKILQQKLAERTK